MTRSVSDDRPLPNGITRDVLERDALRGALAEAHPGVEMVSDEAMQTSIRTMLAGRPPGVDLSGGVWVFGYGSLLWNPCVPVVEWRDVLLYGFHRDFRIRLTHGRGSAEAPGLMLGLVPGGSCRGMALRLPPDNLNYELLMIWRREMLTGVYTPRWVTLRDQNGDTCSAITFVTNAAHHSHCGPLADAEVIAMLATGHGMIGSAAEYLNSTVAHLDEQGIYDQRLRTLRARVNAVVSARHADNG